MSNTEINPNNKIYDESVGNKHKKACAGLKCKNNTIQLFQMSFAIGSSFLCDRCKRSLEHDGWILNSLKNKNNINKEHLKEGYMKRK
jgi:hypothetical protein